MLNMESLNATKDLVAILADKNVMLAPAQGSPLEGLCTVTKQTPSYGLTCLSQIDEMVVDLHAQNSTLIQDGAPVDDLHSAYLGGNAVQIGTALAQHVSFAMTNVLPAVAELHQKFVEVRDHDGLTGPRAYQLVQERSAAIYDISDVTDMLEEMGSVKNSTGFPLVLDYREMDDEGLINLLKAGSSSYDEAIASYIGQVGIETVRHVWREVFTSARSAKNWDGFRVASDDRTAKTLLTFLFALRLWSNPDNTPEVDGSAGLNRSAYRARLRTILEVSGYSCFLNWNQKTQEESSGKLITKVDGKKIYVDASVYDRFLTDGGSADAVLGAAVSSRETYAKAILEKKDGFEEAWKYQVAIEKQTAEREQLTATRRAAVDFVRAYVLENKSGDPVIAENARKIIERANRMVNGVFQSALECLDSLALGLVTSTIFEHTDANRILDSYTRAVQANPDLTQEQALDVAMVEYVCDWYADQVCVA